MLLLLGLLALFHPNAFPPGLCANPHQAPPPFSSRPTNGLKFAKQTSCFLQDAPLDGPRIQTELLTHYKCKCAASSGAAGWKTGCLSWGRRRERAGSWPRLREGSRCGCGRGRLLDFLATLCPVAFPDFLVAIPAFSALFTHWPHLSWPRP